MDFHVGSTVYRLAIAEGPMSDRWGECNERERRIVLGPDVPAMERIRVLFHELAHAWIFETGEPKNLEGWCDLMGAVAARGMRDLMLAGGEEALRRMEPGESHAITTGRVGLTRHRYCGKCGGTVAGGSVQCQTTLYEGMPAVSLELWCGHCDHRQFWLEAATMAGMPSGAVLGEVEFRGVA